jgi:amino acid adenylation domain-containing protein
VQLSRYIELIEQALGRTAEKRLLPLQPGDVPDTEADVDALMRDTGYSPETHGRGRHPALCRLVSRSTLLRGLAAREPAALCLPRGPAYVEALIGCVLAGRPFIPIDPEQPPERNAAVLEDAGAPAIVACAEIIRALAPQLPAAQRWVEVQASPAVLPPPPALQPDDPIYVLFTSGSSGRPKGAVNTHRALVNRLLWGQRTYPLRAQDRVLCKAPFTFDASIAELLWPLLGGACVVLSAAGEHRDPAALIQLIRSEQVSHLYFVPSMLRFFLDTPGVEECRSIQRLLCAGEALSGSLLRRCRRQLPQATVENLYGPTEAAIEVSRHVCTIEDEDATCVSIGRPIANARLYVVDPEGRALDVDEDGELWIGGCAVGLGYLNRPTLSAEVFIDDPFEPGGRVYRSGDRARWRADGALDYLGRIDQQIKLHGVRIEPGEIEARLSALPGVREAAVAVIEDARGEPLLCAAVTPATAPPLATLRAQLSRHLPSAMWPQRLLPLDRLPQLPNGKLDRRAIEARLRAGLVDVAAHADSPAALEARLLAIWREVLGLPQLQSHSPLFECGAGSVQVMSAVARMRAAGIDALGVADVYAAPSVAAQCARLGAAPSPARSNRDERPTDTREPLALIGLAARAPGCANLEALWQALLDGRSLIQRFSDDELDPRLPSDLTRRPNYVPARGVLADAARFDAALFGIGPREAQLIDPQQRLLLELAWETLEHAGITAAQARARGERIGVWAGTAHGRHALELRAHAPERVERSGELALQIATEKDYAATRIAHRLDLRGPAVSVHTACSTGLVAVVEAAEALWAGRCELALAGAATLLHPQRAGYLHVDGGMESADGLCRPFDAEASGTVFSEGAGMVLMKPLSRALADGDCVHAVLLGAGLNNDGGHKASFSAPSIDGQVECLQMALARAGVAAEAVGYIEAHGTGTPLGDPIEVEALRRVYGEHAHAAGAAGPRCLLGSLKSNLGHSVAAAGVLGLIKAALCLARERVPGTLHFRRANPQIDFAATPFEVSAEQRPWLRGPDPRIAAVSSFGVGGTNAHVLLGEAPASAALARDDSALDALPLFPLSGQDAAALAARAADLADWIEAHPQVPLGAVQATLMHGRSPLRLRRSVVACDRSSLLAALRQPQAGSEALPAPRLVFLYPGQGSQWPGMAAGVYARWPAFARALDEALAALAPAQADGLRELLLSADDSEATTRLTATRVADTRHAQPALFAVEYALSRALGELGLLPSAAIGHSLGEFAAAVSAGVMRLDDAARVVRARAEAMAAQPRGGMLAVRASAATLQTLLPPELEIACYNAPALQVVSGPAEAIDRLHGALGEAGLSAQRLQVSHGFHSAAMEGALPALRAALQGVALSAPTLPVYACATGDPLTAAQACSADYWAGQMRAPVRFSAAVQAELARPDTVFIEVGPGTALSSLLRQHRQPDGQLPRVVSLLPTAREDGADSLAHALGELWALGAALRWPPELQRMRATLPGYRFGGERYETPGPTSATPAPALLPAPAAPIAALPPTAATTFNAPETSPMADRRPELQRRLTSVLAEVAGLSESELRPDLPLVEQGLDSLSLTQATLEIDRVFGLRLRFRRLMEDLDTVERLAAALDAELPAGRFAPARTADPLPPAALAAPAAAPADAVALLQQQMLWMQQQLALLGGAAAVGMTPAPAAAASPTPAPPANREPATPAPDLKAQPFGASARIALAPAQGLDARQRAWLDDFTGRYLARSGKSRAFSQQHRARMADPRVVTGFNPQWKDLVYPIVAERSEGAQIWDLDGNAYIDLLGCFGANLLGYRTPALTAAMHAQLDRGIEVGPQHPLAAEVAELISEFTGHARVGFCNTGSEAVMGAMRVARTVTGRKTIAIFTHSYHGIFDEVIVRGTRQLRSLAAAPGILANAVENVLVLDYAADASLEILRQRGHELAAIMIEPVQNKHPTLQPRAFVQALREICDDCGAALIFDEVVTGFRLAPGGAQQFYGVRADLCAYGKIIGGGLPLAALAGEAHWMDALDGGHWQYGDDSYPEAGVTYFAGTFVRHPLALAAGRATLLELRRGGQALYDALNARTQGLIDRLNAAFAQRTAPVRAVHCASLWRLSWDEDQKHVSLFYYLARFHGLHLYEQFGHFVTLAFGEAEIDRVVEVFVAALDELMALGLITPRAGATPRLPAAPEAVESALGPGQTERWLVTAMHREGARALVETYRLTLSGLPSLDALQRAVRTLVLRHPGLRLRIDAERPLQRLGPSEPDYACLDLRAQPSPAAEADASFEVLRARRYAPADGALMAIRLCLLDAARAELQMAGSHLVFDGWATGVFMRELALLLRAESDGGSALLPAAGSPFAFAREGHERIEGAEGTGALAAAAERLRGAPAFSLADLDVRGERSFTADTLQRQYGGPRFVALKALAAQRRCTLYQLLLAITAVALRELSGQHDLVLALPYASQIQGRHPHLISDGVLDLPLRLVLPAPSGPLEALDSVRSALLDALDQPWLTQARAVRALGLSARGDRPALSGVYFNLNPALDLAQFAPIRAEGREGRKPGLLSELIFNFHETADALLLDLHYSTELLSEGRAEAVLGAFERSLEALLPTPAAEASRTCQPPLLLAEVRRQIAGQPQRIALRHGGQGLDYAALGQRIDTIASALRAQGVVSGDRVGLCLPRGFDLPAAMLACFACGAAWVPLDPEYPSSRLAFMAADAGLRLILCARADELPEGLQTQPRLALQTLSAQASTPALADAGEAEASAYVIYTSGTTGQPKGVEVSQANLAWLLQALTERPGLRADDRVLATTTASFDIAIAELLLPLAVGACSVIADNAQTREPAALWRLLADERCSLLQTTPTLMQLWLGSPPPAALRSCRVWLGGEPLAPALAQRLLPLVGELWNLYGPTEATVWASAWRVESPERGVLLGEGLPGVGLHVLDAEGGTVRAGTPGELWISGAGLARGYLARPELSAQRFLALPETGVRAYRSGDLAVLDGPDRLRHLGRIDCQIKLRGHRIELEEIDCALLDLPGVRDAACALVDTGEGDGELWAWLQVDADDAPDPRRLRQQLAERLPAPMLPSRFLRAESLPRLPNGKRDRAALRGLPAAELQVTVSGPPAASAAPDPHEALLAGIWAALLGGVEIDPDASFFDHGGDSLLALRMVQQVEDASGVRLPLLRVGQASLRALAADVAAAASSTAGVRGSWLSRLFGSTSKSREH